MTGDVIARAVVTQVAPTEVRFHGDTSDTPIARMDNNITGLTVNDEVVLLRTSSTGGWIISCVLGATP